MHGHLPAFCREAHGKLLDRAAESGEPVPLEVRQHDHPVRFGQRLCNARALEVFEVDRNGHRFLAVRAVGDDRRDARKTVFLCQREVLLAGEALAAVQHAGLHEMACAALRPDEVDDAVVHLGFQVGAVALLTEMDFQGYVGGQFGSGPLQQSLKETDCGLRKTGCPRGGIERDEENVGHGDCCRETGNYVVEKEFFTVKYTRNIKKNQRILKENRKKTCIF